ncbi:MAG TPA: lysine--tRNA ligase, partial [Dehalococcoidia bacterium]|nr:lysine--tRNA ligase [Dehalococcoidia bacterium]
MTSRLERIAEQRQEKLDRIRARGINPYPHRYHRSHTTRQAIALLKEHETAPEADAVSITVAGRIVAHRSMGPISFMDLRDGSGKIQLMIDKQFIGETYRELLKDLDIGDIIGAGGVLFRTRSGEPTVKAENITLLSKSLKPLPEKWHGLSDVDTRYRQRY